MYLVFKKKYTVPIVTEEKIIFIIVEGNILYIQSTGIVIRITRLPMT
jgi:hypothetical protein